MRARDYSYTIIFDNKAEFNELIKKYISVACKTNWEVIKKLSIFY